MLYSVFKKFTYQGYFINIFAFKLERLRNLGKKSSSGTGWVKV